MTRFATALLAACVLLSTSPACGQDERLLRGRLQQQHAEGGAIQRQAVNPGYVTQQQAVGSQQSLSKQYQTRIEQSDILQIGGMHTEKEVSGFNNPTAPQQKQKNKGSSMENNLSARSLLNSVVQRTSSQSNDGETSLVQQSNIGLLGQQQQPIVQQMSPHETQEGGLRGSPESTSLEQQAVKKGLPSSAIRTQSYNLRSPSDRADQPRLQKSSPMQQQLERQPQALLTSSTGAGGPTKMMSSSTNSMNLSAGLVDVDNGQFNELSSSQSSITTQTVANDMEGVDSPSIGSLSGSSQRGVILEQSSASEADVQVRQTKTKSNSAGKSAERDEEAMSTSGTARAGPLTAITYPDHVEGFATGASKSRTVSKSSNAEGSLDMTVSNRREQAGSTSPRPQHGKFSTQEDAAECNPLKPQQRQVTATWLSSFPGSGSKITWKLIEAITGLFTGDDLDSAGHVESGVAVAIKTHYPSHTKASIFNQKKFSGVSRGVLILRNPMQTLSALFRFVYFIQEQHERTSASMQPPKKAWVTWRNQYFETELQLWIEHIQWWLDNYERENLHLLPYEYLSAPERGSDELQKLGNFLGSTDPKIASSLLQPEKFCCVWEKMVNQGEIDKSTDKNSSSYTAEHLEAMIQGLVGLRDNNKSFPEFFNLINEYLGDIVEIKKELMAIRMQSK